MFLQNRKQLSLGRAAYELPDPTNRDIFSLSWHRLLARRINALMRLRPTRASADGPLVMADGGSSLPLANAASVGNGNGSGMNYRGIYSSGTDYNVNDVVYVGATPSVRYFYVAEIANGPSFGVVAPDSTETGTVYWRLIAQPAPSVQELTFSAWGYGGNNDYITCSGQQVRLPPLLRFSVASRVVYGITITYSAYNATAQSRSANNGTTTVTQYVTPQYVAGDKVYVSSVGGVLQDVNADGRVFAGP